MSDEIEDGLKAELELRQHFAGKRGEERIASDLEVRLENELITLRGVAQDLSRSGVLVLLTGLAPRDFDEIMAWTTMQTKVRFIEPGLAVPATPVRAVRIPGESNVLLALKFTGFLTKYQRKSLGLAVEG